MKKIFLFLIISLSFSAFTLTAEDSNMSTAGNGEGGGAAVKAFGEKITNGLSKGFDYLGEKIDSASDEISKRQLTEVTGKVKVKGKNESLTVTIKDNESGKTYILKTMSGSAQSMKKLSLCRGHVIRVSGVLNTETNILSVVEYSVEDDD